VSSTDGRFSPSGNWVAYSSKGEVYVKSFPLSDSKWSISRRGGGQPLWRKDGKELFYVEPPGKLMSVDVQPGSGTALQAGVPKVLFEIKGLEGGGTGKYRYAASPDGKSFYVVMTDTSNLQLYVALNWTGDLPGR
jgi:eukaryotic-like serine/threonine-protein kinase